MFREAISNVSQVGAFPCKIATRKKTLPSTGVKRIGFGGFYVRKYSILMLNFFEKYYEILSYLGYQMVPSKKFYLNYSPVKKNLKGYPLHPEGRGEVEIS